MGWLIREGKCESTSGLTPSRPCLGSDLVPCPNVCCLSSSHHNTSNLHVLIWHKKSKQTPHPLCSCSHIGSQSFAKINRSFSIWKEISVCRWICQCWCAGVTHKKTVWWGLCGKQAQTKTQPSPKCSTTKNTKLQQSTLSSFGHLYLRGLICRKECQVARVHGLSAPINCGCGDPQRLLVRIGRACHQGECWWIRSHNLKSIDWLIVKKKSQKKTF